MQRIQNIVLRREATLKSMVYFVPKLRNSNIEKAMQRMGRMLREDPEGAIRTNVVICFAKLAPTIATKPPGARVLLGTLLRGLRDPFSPCRLASLQSLAVCSLYFSAEDIVTRILPLVSPRCADADMRVRGTAFLSLEHLADVAKTHLITAGPSPPTEAGGAPMQPAEEEAGLKQDKAAPGGGGGWTGWALKRAVDFYSKSSGKIETAPSGAFAAEVVTPQHLPPTPQVEATTGRSEAASTEGGETAGFEKGEATPLSQPEEAKWSVDIDELSLASARSELTEQAPPPPVHPVAAAATTTSKEKQPIVTLQPPPSGPPAKKVVAKTLRVDEDFWAAFDTGSTAAGGGAAAAAPSAGDGAPKKKLFGAKGLQTILAARKQKEEGRKRPDEDDPFAHLLS